MGSWSQRLPLWANHCVPFDVTLLVAHCSQVMPEHCPGARARPSGRGVVSSYGRPWLRVFPSAWQSPLRIVLRSHTLPLHVSPPPFLFSQSLPCLAVCRAPLPWYISCTFRPVLEKSEPKLMLGDRTLKRHYFLVWSRRKVKNPELVFWKGWVGSQSQQTFMSQHLHKTEVKTVQHRTSWLGDVFQMSI